MTVRRFRIERHQHAVVDVDVEAYLAAWAADRAEWDGDDESFVREGIAADALIVFESSDLEEEAPGVTWLEGDIESICWAQEVPLVEGEA